MTLPSSEEHGVSVSGSTELNALASLRLATASLHRKLESLSPLSSLSADLHGYHAHLSMMRCWLSSIEHWLMQSNALAAFREGLSPQPLLQWIEADLSDNMSDNYYEKYSVLMAGIKWRAQPSHAYIWGVRYVIEGSRLGSALLYKKLKAQFADQPLYFLYGDNGAPGPRWSLFCNMLNQQLVRPAEIEDASHGACDAFAVLLNIVSEIRPE